MCAAQECGATLEEHNWRTKYNPSIDIRSNHSYHNGAMDQHTLKQSSRLVGESARIHRFWLFY